MVEEIPRAKNFFGFSDESLHQQLNRISWDFPSVLGIGETVSARPKSSSHTGSGFGSVKLKPLK